MPNLGESTDPRVDPSNTLLNVCRLGNLSQVECLLDAHEHADLTKKLALQGAAANGHEDVVQLLLERYPSIEVDSYTARNAAQGGLEVYRVLHKKHPDVIRWAFGEIGDVVHCAISSRNVKLLRYVLEQGADPGRTSMCCRYVNRFSPLERATLVSDDPEIADLLLKYGATLEQTTALEIAALLGRLTMVHYLLDVGAAVNYIRDRTDPMFDPRQIHGSPLHSAVRAGSTEIIRALLDYGADPTMQDTAGKTVWYEAQIVNYKEAVLLFQFRTASD